MSVKYNNSRWTRLAGLIVAACLLAGCGAEDGDTDADTIELDSACDGVDFERSNGQACTPSVNDQICYLREDVPCGDGSMLLGDQSCLCAEGGVIDDIGHWQCSTNC